jgi:protein phosphatase
MKVNYAARTDVGKKRKHNEDSYLVDEELSLFVVADGMGGHAAGEVASNEAVETLRDNLLTKLDVIEHFRSRPGYETAENVRRMVDLAVRATAYQVFGLTEMDPERKGMGTTLSVLMLQPQAAFIAHVGDSRIYMIRDGKYRLTTSDHTFVAAMVEQGKMTEEEAKRSKYSNVLIRAVGPHDYVEVDTRVIQYSLDDTFMLCSDGLHGYLKDGELTDFVDIEDVPGSVDRLIEMALDRGGRDNITVILVRIED